LRTSSCPDLRSRQPTLSPARPHSSDSPNDSTLEKLEPVYRKAYRFAPLINRDDVSKGMLGDIVQRVFDGSAEAVMLSLFDVVELDEDELASLRKLLNRKMREAKS
jgi:hypothetical protein